MDRLLTRSRTLHRLMFFLGVPDCPGLLLAHPTLYEACLAAPSISTPLFLRGDSLTQEAQDLFLPSVALRHFPRLRHVHLNHRQFMLVIPDTLLGFFAECVSRGVSVFIFKLGIRPRCLIPTDLCLSVERLSFSTWFSVNNPFIFNGYRFRAAGFQCRVPDWRRFATANPALFEERNGRFPDDVVVDLSSADFSRSQLHALEATPLMAAVDAGEPAQVVAQLAEQWGRCLFQQQTALMRAAAAGNAALVAVLAPTEARIVCPRTAAATALAAAAAAGHAAVVELLLPLEVRLGNCDGVTALMNAAQHGHEACVALLLAEEGPMADFDGRTALSIAQRNGHAGCAALLKDSVPKPPQLVCTA
jgi:hypothetical protein